MKISKPEVIPISPKDQAVTEIGNGESRFLSYGALLLFCLFAGLRDVFSEWVFKTDRENLKPEAALLIYTIVTVFSALLFLAARRGKPLKVLKTIFFNRHLRSDALAVSFYTFLSFFAYFVAIGTHMGAGLTAFADYAISPFGTAILATVLLGEILDRTFWISLIPCLLGITIFVWQRADVGTIDRNLLLGVVLTIISAITGSLYRVYSKRLLNNGIDRVSLLAIRYMLCIPLLSIYCFFQGSSIVTGGAGWVLLASPVLFTFPLFMSIFALQKINIKTYVLVMFALPVLTFLISFGFGQTQGYLLDIVAALFIFAGIYYYEKNHRHLKK